MPQIRGVKCEECPHTKFEGDPEDPRSEPWHTILVGENLGKAMIILNPHELEIPKPHDLEPFHLKPHYLSSASCLFSHIAKLLKIDPTTLHR